MPGQIFPASVGYQLSARVLEGGSPLTLAALRVGIAPQSGCTAGAITAAAAAVLHRDGCEAVLRATYVDATRSYVATVGVAVLPTDAAAAAATAVMEKANPARPSARAMSAAARRPRTPRRGGVSSVCGSAVTRKW